MLGVVLPVVAVEVVPDVVAVVVVPVVVDDEGMSPPGFNGTISSMITAEPLLRIIPRPIPLADEKKLVLVVEVDETGGGVTEPDASKGGGRC